MKTLRLFLFASTITFSQQLQPKQITYFDFDCRSPVFISYPLNLSYPVGTFNSGKLIFEAHKDSSVNIYVLNYDVLTDSFYEAIPITNDNFINRNATAVYYNDREIIIWETNKNGNWDLAYSTNSGSGWSESEILFQSINDETNPVFVLQPTEWFEGYNLLYEIDGSVYLYHKNQDSVLISVVFEKNGETKYSLHSGYKNSESEIFIAAIEENGVNQPRLIYTDNYIPGQYGTTIQNLYNLYPVRNPKFVDLAYYSPIINFEIEINGKFRSVLLDELNFGTNSGEILVDSDTTIETSDFNAYVFYIITEIPFLDASIPYAYEIKRNDSTFILASQYFAPFPYQEVYTKVDNPLVNIGTVTLDQNDYTISYSVWEDSAGSNINLFGLKRIDASGDVKDEGLTGNFSLSQNYPNPFNPSTSIQYAVGSRQFVTLIVFDVLGREVATLVNEEKQPGVYEVEFSAIGGSAYGGNAKGLSSGIYFYKLQTENYSSTKKMIYLK